MSVLEGRCQSKGIGRRVKDSMAGQGPMERQRMSRLKWERPGRIKLTRVGKWQQEKADVGGARGGEEKREWQVRKSRQGKCKCKAWHGKAGGT